MLPRYLYLMSLFESLCLMQQSFTSFPKVDLKSLKEFKKKYIKTVFILEANLNPISGQNKFKCLPNFYQVV